VLKIGSATEPVLCKAIITGTDNCGKNVCW